MAEFIEKVDQDKFVEIFKAWEYNSFSDEALRKIYDIETETNENEFISIDKVVINTSWNEYKDWNEFVKEYSQFCDDHNIENTEQLNEYETVYVLHETDTAFLVVPF